MSSPKDRVILTLVGRKKDVKDTKKSLDNDVTAVKEKLPPGGLYAICEKFDTYLKGGKFMFKSLACFISSKSKLFQ